MKNKSLFFFMLICSISAYSQIKSVGNNYNLIYHRLEFTVNPTEYYIVGAVTTYFKPITNHINEISFDFSDGLKIDSIIYNKNKIKYLYEKNILSVLLPKDLKENVIDSVSVYYQGKPADSGFNSFTKSQHDGTPIIWTLSEPMGARDWWPCKQSLTDKADSIDIIIKNPVEYKAASNGILINEKVVNGQRIAHWKHKYKIAAYLVAFAVTNYVTYTDYCYLPSGDTIKIINYVYPESENSARTNTPVTAKQIQLFSKLFIPYPFKKEKYGHAQFGWGGGMEHQTMSFMIYFSSSLIAHELAHQWFGDWITCGSWSDVWLNEGFATYLEGLACKHGLGDETWEEWLTDKIRSITSSNGGSLFVRDSTSVWKIFDSRLSYNKGAMLVHMLRWELGDTLFLKAIRNYLTDKKNSENFANTAFLQKHIETVSGRSFKEFFNDWLYGEGYPKYNLKWNQNNENMISLFVDQKPSHESVNFFEMHIPVKFVGENKDTIVRLNNSKPAQYFVFQLPFKIKKIIFDPDRWILTKKTRIEKDTAKIDNADILFEAKDNEFIIKSKKDFFSEKITIYNKNGEEIHQILNTKISDKTVVRIPKKIKGKYFFKFHTSNSYILKSADL